MSTAPRPGMIRFDGIVQAFFVCICEKCDHALPFETPELQMQWALNHGGATGHAVTFATDIRPDPAVTENRRRDLTTKLRKKYSHPSTRPVVGCSGCPQMIVAGDPTMEWNGKHWHANCIDDGTLMRMASMVDLIPDLFKDVEPVTIKRWDPASAVGFVVRAGNNGPYHFGGERFSGDLFGAVVDKNPMARAATFVANLNDAVRGVTAPKKPNARERRRLKRAGKQWQN